MSAENCAGCEALKEEVEMTKESLSALEYDYNDISKERDDLERRLDDASFENETLKDGREILDNAIRMFPTCPKCAAEYGSMPCSPIHEFGNMVLAFAQR